MKRTIIAAALLAASLGAQAQDGADGPCNPVAGPCFSRVPMNPQIVLTDGRGNHTVQVAFDGVRLFGGATFSFSPTMITGMALPIVGQAGWAMVRVGDQFYALPLYALAPRDESARP